MLSASKSVQHFARLVTKLYMELVREFDISQQKVNHFPQKDGKSGQRTALQPTMILIIVHYTSFQCIIIYYRKVFSHKESQIFENVVGMLQSGCAAPCAATRCIAWGRS